MHPQTKFPGLELTSLANILPLSIGPMAALIRRQPPLSIFSLLHFLPLSSSSTVWPPLAHLYDLSAVDVYYSSDSRRNFSLPDCRPEAVLKRERERVSCRREREREHRCWLLSALSSPQLPWLAVDLTTARQAAGLFAASWHSCRCCWLEPQRAASPLSAAAAVAASVVDLAADLAAAAQVSFFKLFLSFLFAHGSLQIPATFSALLLEKKKKGGPFEIVTSFGGKKRTILQFVIV
ncbi:hypothetical protein M9H77_07405 [Catharanthus roseus]|uniref:Uncharacterized protein n=1 Tax=Catharanthus roseus TaxID=4058 RepID=A0ACC0BV05_CATRO|nr:hypothetical protein M9H77_07405 [Catharanthus roseus]